MKRLFIFIGVGLLFNASANAVAKALDGQAIFTKNCSVCHSVNPPPKSAPPIAPLASRYHIKFKNKKDGVDHIVAYLKSPDEKRAIEPQAIARFGLMPASPLLPAELRAVAEWVWDHYNMATCTGRGVGGQGMGRRRMNQY